MKSTQTTLRGDYLLEIALQKLGEFGVLGIIYLIHKFIDLVDPPEYVELTSEQTAAMLGEAFVQLAKIDYKKSEGEPGYNPRLRELVDENGGVKALGDILGDSSPEID